MENLTPLQSKILKALADSTLADSFYWTGGTALAALHLNHRASHDVDLFSEEPFTREATALLVDAVKKEAGVDNDELEKRSGHDRMMACLCGH